MDAALSIPRIWRLSLPARAALDAATAEPNKMNAVLVKSRMKREGDAMSFARVGRENSTSIDL
jgi:hypothetical protein